MSDKGPNVILRTSPHLRVSPPVDVIMRNVVYALLPVCLYSVYQFGISALALIIVCTAACVLTEHVFCKLSGKPSTVGDWSAVISGMLLALCLPPGFPLWMAAVAGFTGIGLGKVFFGGLGFNVMNPALIGRAFAQASFTVPMTTWSPSMVSGRFTEFIPSTLTLPFLKPNSITEWLAQAQYPDAFSGATPLALMKFEPEKAHAIDTTDMFLGTIAGSAGETSALIILLGGIYLIARRMMDWKITASILATAAIMTAVMHAINPVEYPTVMFTLCSGGLMLGAVFMATDMVASPVTPLGVILYGVLIGFFTMIIRFWGGLNEGVMYAILLGNAFSPLISLITQPRIYGAKPPKAAA